MNDNDLPDGPASDRQQMGRVLVVAGSDSGGGAGIQADIKTITVLGAYAATAVSAITVQNTLGVSQVFPLEADLVRAQMQAVLDDIGADVVKIGMLHSSAVIEAVAMELDARSGIDLVVDPVMVATGGAVLLEDDAMLALRNLLVPMATILTPNMPEAAALTGKPVETLDDQKRAGDALIGLGPKAVLVKGGHGHDAVWDGVDGWLVVDGDFVVNSGSDVVLAQMGDEVVSFRRLDDVAVVVGDVVLGDVWRGDVQTCKC